MQGKKKGDRGEKKNLEESNVIKGLRRSAKQLWSHRSLTAAHSEKQRVGEEGVDGDQVLLLGEKFLFGVKVCEEE